jgi:hypothetical protein
MRCVLVLCALAACTYPEKEFDGPFTCLGKPQPTTADPLVKLSGVTTDPSNLTPIAGVTVVLQNAQMNPVFTTTSDAAGNFNFALNTNRTPAAGFDLFASASGKVNTYYYPARDITHDLTIPTLAVLSMQEATNLSLGATGAPPTMGDGSILLTVNDCNGLPLSGATVAATAGTVRYFTGVQPSMTTAATDAGGVVLVANVPPGKVTLTARVMGMTLPAKSFTAVADTFIQTELQP